MPLAGCMDRSANLAHSRRGVEVVKWKRPPVARGLYGAASERAGKVLGLTCTCGQDRHNAVWYGTFLANWRTREDPS